MNEELLEEKQLDEERGVVLVTGASGFTGSTAVDYLLLNGYPVLATDRPNSDFKAVRRHKRFMNNFPDRYEGVTLDIETADLTKPASLKKLLKKRNIRYLMHPAAVFDLSAPEELLQKVNVEGTRNLFDALSRFAPELAGTAVWSTSMVYGNEADMGPITEESRPAPANCYAESKLKQEEVVMEYFAGGIKSVILRPATVYGPRGQYGISKGLAPLAWNNFFPVIPVPGDGDTVSSYVHVDDVVGAAMHLIYAVHHDSVGGQVFNVADDTPQSASEMLDETSRELHVSKPSLNVPDAAYKLYSRVAPYGSKVPFLNIEREEIPFLLKDHVISNTKLKNTGYTLKYPDTMDGLKVTIDWYARNKKLPRIWYVSHKEWRAFWKDIPLHERPFADYGLVCRAAKSSK